MIQAEASKKDLTMRFFGRARRETIAALAIVCGSICLVGAGVWAGYSYRVKATALRARGTITQLVERHDDHGDSFFPVFQYLDRGGIKRTVYSNVGTYPPAYKLGDSVEVLYSAGSEDRAQLDDWWFFWGIPLVLGVLGVIYLPVGIVLWQWPGIRRKVGTGVSRDGIESD